MTLPLDPADFATGKRLGLEDDFVLERRLLVLFFGTTLSFKVLLFETRWILSPHRYPHALHGIEHVFSMSWRPCLKIVHGQNPSAAPQTSQASTKELGGQ
jgi:hypothetical protein